MTIRHRNGKATIYGRSESNAFYRVAWKANGKRLMKAYVTYAEAREEAEKKAKEIAKGNQAASLTAGQAADAVTALETLEAFRRSTGRTESLKSAVGQFCEAAAKLDGVSFNEAVDRFLGTVATIKRKDVGEAVEEFIASRQHKTEARDGRRPQLSEGYAYNVAMWLKEFAKTFPNAAVCDITKEHLNAYMGNHVKVAPKTRNERRNVVRMFLRWAVRQDYLPANHRLFEASGMEQENAAPEEIDTFNAKELRALLENANDTMRPIIALVALGGLRLEEAMRLTWEDVFRIPGHVEVSVAKSKTRSRRLVTVCAALEAWLAPFRNCSGPLWTAHRDTWFAGFVDLLTQASVTAKRNGLRHGFVSHHFALNGNENLTAAEAGNSPAMIHRSYKGLVTKAEAQRWFDVRPASKKNVIHLASKRA